MKWNEFGTDGDSPATDGAIQWSRLNIGAVQSPSTSAAGPQQQQQQMERERIAAVLMFYYI